MKLSKFLEKARILVFMTLVQMILLPLMLIGDLAKEGER